MIRFNIIDGSLRPIIPEDATPEVADAANLIAQRLNAIQGPGENYKTLMESLDQTLQRDFPEARNLIDSETVADIENFYEKATSLTQWDSTKQGVNLSEFDPKFYAKQVPNEVASWNNAKTGVSFAGQKIADVDITKKYPDLNSFLHADYTFVGSPSGRLGKPKPLEEYKETLRPPTDQERQILRDTLVGKTAEKPYSLAEQATQSYIDKQGERVFGALSADVLKQTINEYGRALKQEQMSGLLQNMGMPSMNNLKQDIKNSILGDMTGGGFLNLGDGLSKKLDTSLGIGSSVAYNWQKWFEDTLAKRYENMSEIADPTEANTKYAIEQQFAKSFVNDYLKPRFDTSKSITEFISYMDVKEDEQNVLQTQLASSALKDFANRQAKTYIDELGNKTVERQFDPNFYWNPELITGTDVTNKKTLYEQQKQDVQNAWDNRNGDAAVKDGKDWKQLAYEYGVDLNNKNDFARLHYTVLGKDKNYDPVADTYTRKDLATFIQGDLANALQSQKASFGNPVFLDFVSAEKKAQEFVDKLDVANLPADLKQKLKDLGVNESTDPANEVRDALASVLRTDPALQIREQIRLLNEQKITPTQEQLGYGYIQRKEDEKVDAPAGGSALFNIFKKAGYGGSESEFYTEFFPDATEEDKNLSLTSGAKGKSSTGLEGLIGFSMPDFSDPFSAMSSLDTLLGEDSTKSKETYTPTRSNYFKYFQDEEDAGAPSYFNMDTKSPFSSLFG